MVEGSDAPLLMRMERCLALARLAEHWASASNTGAECNVSSKVAQRQAVDWPESASVMAAVGVASSQSAQKQQEDQVGCVLGTVEALVVNILIALKQPR